MISPGSWEPIGPFAGGGWRVSFNENSSGVYISNEDGNAADNAKLIAAAPYLLNCLVAMKLAAELGVVPTNLDEINAAIARASG